MSAKAVFMSDSGRARSAWSSVSIIKSFSPHPKLGVISRGVAPLIALEPIGVGVLLPQPAPALEPPRIL